MTGLEREGAHLAAVDAFFDADDDPTDGNRGGPAAWYDGPDELEVLSSVLGWARPFLAVTDVPVFGSPEWLALPPGTVRWAAAIVRAALVWWRCGEPIDDDETRARLDEAELRGVDPHDGLYRENAAEYARRREVEQAQARLPRPDDHPGGPVPVWGPTARDAA